MCYFVMMFVLMRSIRVEIDDGDDDDGNDDDNIPVNPTLHSQRKELTRSIHVALWRHGDDSSDSVITEHSSMFTSHTLPVHSTHLETNPH